MSNVPIKPQRPNRSFLGEAAVEAPQPANNMRSNDKVSMTFLMPRAWHTEFKMTAAMRGGSMHELLEECYAVWKREQSKNADQ